MTISPKDMMGALARLDLNPDADGLHLRIACEGGSDEHWQVRWHADDEMPAYVWSAERGLEPHPDAPERHK